MVGAISFTALGVIALFSYFFHIDYFPLFDLQAASSYLLAVAWVLAILIIFLTLGLLLPHVVTGMTLKVPKTERAERKLAETIVFWTGFGMLTLFAFSTSVLIAVWLDIAFSWILVVGLVTSAFLYAARAFLYTRKLNRKYGSHTRALWKKKLVRKLFFGNLGTAAVTALLQIFPLLILLLMFARASASTEDDYITFFTASCAGALFSAVVGGSVLYVAFIPRHRKYCWVVLCAVIALPIILSVMSHATGMVPMTMARLTKIGNFRAEKLVLSPKACGTIAPILGIDCDEKTSPPIQLCNVHIMSRVGPETYLRIADRDAGTDKKYPVHRILLPTADIASMEVNFDIKVMRLDFIDTDLGSRSSACDATLTTLHGDSAFAFDDFTLTDMGKAQLLTFVQEIKGGARGIEEVKVTGHADQIGATKRNDWLAERRAQEVGLFIKRRLANLAPGIKISATSKGSTEPLMKECGSLTSQDERIKCEAPNRRVELDIVKKAWPTQQ